MNERKEPKKYDKDLHKQIYDKSLSRNEQKLRKQQTQIDSLKQEVEQVRGRLNKALTETKDANIQAIKLGVELWNLENSKSLEEIQEASGGQFDIQ